jgi:hypothetical protein
MRMKDNDEKKIELQAVKKWTKMDYNRGGIHCGSRCVPTACASITSLLWQFRMICFNDTGYWLVIRYLYSAEKSLEGTYADQNGYGYQFWATTEATQEDYDIIQRHLQARI